MSSSPGAWRPAFQALGLRDWHLAQAAAQTHDQYLGGVYERRAGTPLGFHYQMARLYASLVRDWPADCDRVEQEAWDANASGGWGYVVRPSCRELVLQLQRYTECSALDTREQDGFPAVHRGCIEARGQRPEF